MNYGQISIAEFLSEMDTKHYKMIGPPLQKAIIIHHIEK